MENNFNKIIPTLPVKSIDATLAYYRDVLGYEIAGRHEDAFGSVTRGRRAAVNIYFFKTDREIQPSVCYVFVDEVDDLCREFRSKGATILEEPEDKFWSYRQFLLQDLNGHLFHYFRFLENAE